MFLWSNHSLDDDYDLTQCFNYPAFVFRQQADEGDDFELNSPESMKRHLRLTEASQA
jgi:hypothetical protein